MRRGKVWLAAMAAGMAWLPALAVEEPLRRTESGYTIHGEWATEVLVTPSRWKPGDTLQVRGSLWITNAHLANLEAAKIKADGFVFLITAERTFDPKGVLRLPCAERMSTLLTPTGLPIEGGVVGAVTNRFGYAFRTPVDILIKVPMREALLQGERRQVPFQATYTLPADLPPGIYRIRVDYGVTVGSRNYSLNGDGFAVRPFFKGRPTESHLYMQPVRADGVDVSGRAVNADEIRPRIPWVLLYGYNSNGYRGVVADEDKAVFGISGRNLIQDDVILPRYDAAGRALSYTLEPQFLTDTIELRSNIPWDYTKGEISVLVYNPDGSVTDLGTHPFVGNTGQWPTTRKTAITAWRPPAYGQYRVRATGWIADIWGNRYYGGGNYRFWIANRMTMITATFQGMPYPVGSRYSRDLAFAPAAPCDVKVDARLFVNSDPSQVKVANWGGKATEGGVFTAAQGNQSLLLDAPGEYLAHVIATYTDPKGHLWVSSYRHAGVVYDPNGPIVARGKKVVVGGKPLERGNTNFEGWVDTATETNYLAHINFPYNSGDVLLIASEGQGANKIEPVLLYEWKKNPQPWDTRWNSIGVTNVELRTSNGLSPHLFPEFITQWAYYYAAAPRPGFMGRFLVGENNARAPYWPTSPNSFGGQINASANGDLPGDIYRLLGGVVLRRQGEPPAYAGYMASAFLLPKGSNNNRVIAAGSEDLIGPDGRTARAFLVAVRPGMIYHTGMTFAAAMQIDPILPVNVRFTLQYPDGRTVVAQGTGDSFGSFVGKERWVLDVPGIYRYNIDAEWNGYPAIMPGLPASGGEFYVLESDRPKNAPELTLDLPADSTFNPLQGLNITGRTSAESVYYAAVIPGAVLDQGYLPVREGKFAYFFNPTALSNRIKTYDTVNRVTGKAEIGDVVHLTFFSKERSPLGPTYHSFQRVILRGTRVLVIR